MVYRLTGDKYSDTMIYNIAFVYNGAIWLDNERGRVILDTISNAKNPTMEAGDGMLHILLCDDDAIFTEALKTLASVLKSVTGNDGMAALIKAFMTYKTITKGIDIFSFFNTKKNSFTQTQNAMNAFFQSAINGTMQVKDGFVQIGEVQKNIFYRKSGFGKSI